MAKSGENPRHATDVIHEIRVEEGKKHEEALERHTTHLCIHNWRDVLWITGALGAGVALAKFGDSQLKGPWRAAPMAVGLVLSIAARRTDRQRVRFAHKAALAVGGVALVTAAIHYNLQGRIDADRALEV